LAEICRIVAAPDGEQGCRHDEIRGEQQFRCGPSPLGKYDRAEPRCRGRLRALREAGIRLRLDNRSRSPRIHPGFAAFHHTNKGEPVMSVARVTEITASSPKSFEDATRIGIERANKTLENVKGAWIQEQKLKIEGGRITEYRVNMKITFILKD